MLGGDGATDADVPRCRSTRRRVMRLLNQAETRELHDAGFARVADFVRVSVPEPIPAITRLLEIIDFRRRRAGWGYLDGDAMRALRGGDWDAWMIALPASHRLVAEQGTIFQTRADWGPPVLLIKPVPMSPEWAGLGQIHESSHLRDISSGLEPIHPDKKEWALGEVRAFQAEIALADLISGGQYVEAVSNVAHSLGLGDVQDLMAEVGTGGDRLATLGGRLDPLLRAGAPESFDEEGLRFGLHLVALGFSMLEGELNPSITHSEFVIELTGLGPSGLPDTPGG